MTSPVRQYPQTYTTMSRVLLSARQVVWTSAQLSILDMVIDMLADDFVELNPRFDTERFKTAAGYRRDRIDQRI